MSVFIGVKWEKSCIYEAAAFGGGLNEARLRRMKWG